MYRINAELYLFGIKLAGELNELKWGILENFKAQQKAELRDTIREQVTSIQEAYPYGTASPIFVGSADDGYDASIIVEFQPELEGQNKYDVIVTTYSQKITLEETKRAINDVMFFNRLPLEAAVGFKPNGEVSSTFNTMEISNARRFGTPYGGKYSVDYRPQDTLFMNSPMEKVSLKYLQGIHNVITKVIDRAGIPQSTPSSVRRSGK